MPEVVERLALARKRGEKVLGLREVGMTVKLWLRLMKC